MEGYSSRRGHCMPRTAGWRCQSSCFPPPGCCSPAPACEGVATQLDESKKGEKLNHIKCIWRRSINFSPGLLFDILLHHFVFFLFLCFFFYAFDICVLYIHSSLKRGSAFGPTRPNVLMISMCNECWSWYWGSSRNDASCIFTRSSSYTHTHTHTHTQRQKHKHTHTHIIQV